MAKNRIKIRARRRKVFKHLMNPYTYPGWLVGAKEIRGVDGKWPKPGAAFHHSLSPAGTVKDKTKILDVKRPELLVLEAFARPFGIGRVSFKLASRGRSTLLTMHEEPENGTKLRLLKPLLDPLIEMRNRKSLRQLRRMIEKT